jgi:hypothetical protein
VTGLARLLPIALLALVALPSAAQADLKAKTSLTTKAGATKIVTKLTSDSPVGDQKRPRKVKVKGGGETYRLSRVGGASAAVVKLGTWRSDAYRGADAEALLDLAGDKVKVIVKSLAGRTTLRSKVAVPDESTPPPDPDPDPDPDTPDPEPGDITGQAAIDQMTTELNGTFIHDPGNPEYALHMCENGDARYFSQYFYEGFVTAVEKFGNPWSVTEAIIKQNGDKAAVVHVTWTSQHDETGAYQQINESFDTVLEYVGGQWYWAGELSTSGGPATCEPTF